MSRDTSSYHCRILQGRGEARWTRVVRPQNPASIAIPPVPLTPPRLRFHSPLSEHSVRTSRADLSPRSCPRPRIAGQPSLPARESHVVPQALVWTAHELASADALLSVQTLPQLGRLHIDPCAGPTGLAQAKVIRPTQHRPYLRRRHRQPLVRLGTPQVPAVHMSTKTCITWIVWRSPWLNSLCNTASDRGCGTASCSRARGP